MTKPSVFDVHSENYRETHNQYLPVGVKHDQFRDQKLDWVRLFLNDLQENDASVLDFGCNSGELCFDISGIYQKMKVVGIDESTASIRVAKEKFEKLSRPNVLFFHSLNEVPKDEKFDVITIFNVLHHVIPSERLKVLEVLKKRLKPNGKILIWEHNRWNPLTRYLVKICPFDEGVVLVSSRWLKNALIVNQLGVQKFEYVNVVTPSLQIYPFFRFIESFFRRIPIGAQYRLVVTLSK